MDDDNILITGGFTPPDIEIRKLREEIEELKKENERLKEAIEKALSTLNGDD